MLKKNLAQLNYNRPISVDSYDLLNRASQLFHKYEVDNLLVTEKGQPIGILDIQDLN
ncbi:CBS domain-containing protein [Xanthovirga aplysinae]|uniref:CBS domain-containing protein n=1 Tax=Xanthovirga aplysinae TaxID=2529853 RepID=UPI001FE2E282|nr:CBS domain-containing protein [Xanthovirga aplysinae]